ncbi:MAG TPA: hypothetical protein VMB03_06085 [Bryobacteraceae bacterium]|nr:hypothetical protein [Bryobacteraceae bacterium]
MRYQFTRPSAVFAVAILAAIAAFCPLLLCAQPDSGAGPHSCCPKHSHHPGPLPCDATSHACPYTLLERAKSAGAPLAVLPPAIRTVVAPVERCELARILAPAITFTRHLYLRNGVLLI